MNDSRLIRSIDVSQARGEHAREFLRREWLLANGLGGYASGTIAGYVSRRYHGLLVAALPAPLGRVVMLNHLAEYLRFSDGQKLQMSGEEVDPSEPHCLCEFRLEAGIPTWRYEAGRHVIQKRVLLIHGQNTVHVTFD